MSIICNAYLGFRLECIQIKKSDIIIYATNVLALRLQDKGERLLHEEKGLSIISSFEESDAAKYCKQIISEPVQRSESIVLKEDDMMNYSDSAEFRHRLAGEIKHSQSEPKTSDTLWGCSACIQSADFIDISTQ